jgi:hypothetical protein
MTDVCQHCGSKKFPDELSSICCNNGNISLDAIPEPPECIKSLLDGSHADSKHFLTNARKYNNAFAMTSFSSKSGNTQGWTPTFRIHGQVYHTIGSLLPDNDMHKYMQIYFLDSTSEETATRMNIHTGLKASILQSVQSELHANNYWVNTFRTARDVILAERNDELAIIINEDNRPPGEHRRRYNKQISNEVAVIMPDDTRGSNRDIVVKFRSGGLQRINELNHSYDPLQYPILFPHGDFGYNINMTDTRGKKLSIMHYYA